MKFFAVHIEDLESERFLAATNDQVATWLFLHALCSKRCNGGTISEASALTDRFWSRHGIDSGILAAPSPLWSWNGDALTVEPYDIAGQTVFERKVAGGKTRAKLRWGSSPDRGPDSSPSRTPISGPDSSCNAPNITQQYIPPLIPPDGGSASGERFLPKGWKSLTREERKRRKADANSPTMQRIGTFFGRKPETLWTIAEGAALFEIKPPAEEVDLLARYYALPLDKEADFRRRDLITLLNNWQGEVDRARSFFASTSNRP